jgi:hypothetical protein
MRDGVMGDGVMSWSRVRGIGMSKSKVVGRALRAYKVPISVYC